MRRPTEQLLFFIKFCLVAIASDKDIRHPVWGFTHDTADGFVIDILTTFDNEFIGIVRIGRREMNLTSFFLEFM